MPRPLNVAVTLLAVLLLVTITGCPQLQMGRTELTDLPADPPDDAWFQEAVVNSPLPVLVDFTATWCGPCKRLEPLLVRLEEEYSGRLEVVKVDADENPHLVKHYNVPGYPTLMVVVQGQVVDSSIGLVDYERLQKLVTPHLAAGG
jgi:thioredoxin 1